ncbi:PASTA domain-containing protein [Nocardioides sp. SR21]|uniref:PASTA domain-containing protein n=1 Tax=Nocardioides sp. SR21 TaxID=2919501 RepID=UPI001FA97CF7|nr:PASTA domain-containing protein [Nocardioides sp. SR21]
MSERSASSRRSGLTLALVLAVTLLSVPSAQAESGDETGCLVPYLRGLRLPAVRVELEWANCSLGNVHRKTTTPDKRGKVLSQSPPAGRVRPAFHPVGVTIGR